MAGGKVIVIQGGSDGGAAAFKAAMDQAGDKLVVVDFTATWCGPCKMIAPYFEELSEKFPDRVFLKVDVDECADVASEKEVKAMPTFMFFKNGVKIGDVVGADKDKLAYFCEHETPKPRPA